MSTAPKRIRIVGLSPGEAPLEVRQAWIGLDLPLADGYQKERRISGLGVLTGPRSFLGLLRAWIFRRGEPTNSFVVESAKALEVLQAERPLAAVWWQENAAYFFEPGQLFAFSSDIFDEVGPE